MPETDYYGYTNSGASTAATGQDAGGHGSNPSGFTPMYIGDWHPPVDDGTGAPSGGGGGGDSGGGGGRPTDQQVIDQLGYDPGDPRNNLSTTGFGTGGPTQRGIGFIANFLGNAAFPGLGMLTGPMASKITQMIQNGASQRAVQNAIQQHTGGGASVRGLEDVTGGGSSGGGFNFGNAFGGLPSGFTESNRFGGGAPIFTAPGAKGPGWAPGGSVYGGLGSLGMSLPGSFAGLGSFSGGDPLSGAWGGINSPVGRSALLGGQGAFNPALTPNPGFQWGKGANVTGPGNMPIVNWGAFGQGSSPGQSIHFQPKSVQ